MTEIRAEWRLPDEPAPDVLAVRAVGTGERWNRLTAPPELAGLWIVDNPVLVPPPQVLDWPSVVALGKHLVPAEPVTIAPMRYPENRPGWLGEWQPYPCGRCGKEVDGVEAHECVPDQEADASHA